MGPLSRLALAATFALIASPVSAERVDRWAREIAQASKRFGIPPSWIREVMDAESNGRTALLGAPIISAAGAMGLMQLMPGTWAEMRLAHGLGGDPFDPHDNILAGAAYLRAMYDRFGYPGLFAAYNAGPSRYARSLAGADLPEETVRYSALVTGRIERTARLDRTARMKGRALAARGARLFVIRAQSGPQDSTRSVVQAPDPLPAIMNWRFTRSEIRR